MANKTLDRSLRDIFASDPKQAATVKQELGNAWESLSKVRKSVELTEAADDYLEGVQASLALAMLTAGEFLE